VRLTAFREVILTFRREIYGWRKEVRMRAIYLIKEARLSEIWIVI
jgi:hypothetical protein